MFRTLLSWSTSVTRILVLLIPDCGLKSAP